jgi:hypothetical protein
VEANDITNLGSFDYIISVATFIAGVENHHPVFVLGITARA